MVTDIYNPSIKKAKEDNSVSKQHIYSFRLFFFSELIHALTCFQGLERCSAVDTALSERGSRLDSKHLHGNLQVSVSAVPSNLTPSGLHKHQTHKDCTHTCQ